jgi:hypothetical protein
LIIKRGFLPCTIKEPIVASKKDPFANQRPEIFVTLTPEQQKRVDTYLDERLRSAAAASPE